MCTVHCGEMDVYCGEFWMCTVHCSVQSALWRDLFCGGFSMWTVESFRCALWRVLDVHCGEFWMCIVHCAEMCSWQRKPLIGVQTVLAHATTLEDDDNDDDDDDDGPHLTTLNIRVQN